MNAQKITVVTATLVAVLGVSFTAALPTQAQEDMQANEVDVCGYYADQPASSTNQGLRITDLELMLNGSDEAKERAGRGFNQESDDALCEAYSSIRDTISQIQQMTGVSSDLETETAASIGGSLAPAVRTNNVDNDDDVATDTDGNDNVDGDVAGATDATADDEASIDDEEALGEQDSAEEVTDAELKALLARAREALLGLLTSMRTSEA